MGAYSPFVLMSLLLGISDVYSSFNYDKQPYDKRLCIVVSFFLPLIYTFEIKSQACESLDQSAETFVFTELHPKYKAPCKD